MSTVVLYNLQTLGAAYRRAGPLCREHRPLSPLHAATSGVGEKLIQAFTLFQKKFFICFIFFLFTAPTGVSSFSDLLAWRHAVLMRAAASFCFIIARVL